MTQNNNQIQYNAQSLQMTVIKRYYYAIFHSWFVSSNGFDCVKIEAENKQEARQKAKAINYDKDSTFNKTEFYLLEINDTETLKKDFDHKLTKIPRLIRWLYNAL